MPLHNLVYRVAKFTVMACESKDSAGTNLADLMRRLQSFISPVIRVYDAYGCDICFACTVNKMSLSYWSGTRDTLDLHLGCFDDIESVLKLIVLSPSGEFEIGDKQSANGILFDLSNFAYTIPTANEFDCKAYTGEVRAHYPMNGYYLHDPFEKQPEAPTSTRCYVHEPVNVSFMHIKMIIQKLQK